MRRRPSPRRAETERRASDLRPLAGLAALLWLWFELPFAMHGLRFPLGPDGPVYLWWTRLAGHDGLSAVARPGVPAVALVLGGATGAPLTAVIAGLEISLSVALGLACWALARGGGAERWTALAAGLLGGTFAVHLAAGYLATLAFAAAFVAALAAFADDGRRPLLVAAALLAAATFAHPLFGPLAIAILALAAALSWRSARADVRRIALVVGGAVAAVVAGLLALQLGPGPLHVDTSRDGFLRRAGLGDTLRSAYLDRFVHRWTRYVEWISVPLAFVGWRSPRGFVVRVLAAWAILTVVGVAFALATGWLPADRFITFGFAIPILAAFGLARVWTWLGERRRTLAVGATAVLVGWMLVGAWIAWARQEPFVEDREVEQVTAANAVSSTAPAGTPLAFVVDQTDETLSFLATRAGNVVRAAVAPDRIRDVVIVVPPGRGDVERHALSRVTEEDLRAATRARPPLWFFTTAFDPVGAGVGDAAVVTDIGPGVRLGAAAAPRVTVGRVAPVDPLEPAATWDIALGSLAQLAVFAVGGYGWARAAGFERGASAALAPALGWAALALVAIALERLGVPIGSSLGAVLTSALAIAGGFLVLAVDERRGRSAAPREVA